ncbi:MAG: hypothetical protein ACFCBW_16800, partial [Candidatus Competibacterales bacterium]
ETGTAEAPQPDDTPDETVEEVDRLIAQAREEGRIQGIAEERLRIARELVQVVEDDDALSEATRLPVYIIRQLR